ncbi:two-component system, chemotaxis family, sensor kinase CheA [Sulfitobacter marinus]|uniref:Chemotaxis protein CheA n=1 Tax=Sulfitobacter marinus TaxID=394264 RepID=A0A1I6QYL9_9RHOB|nr:chemotaxis protein CheA [Sulfitobacter marinus]SFS57569.1 two-component system, chemotaxis family, sensor kinase CheA [Sulfitobacter marinus]
MSSLTELRAIFFQECEEQLEDLTDGLNAIEAEVEETSPDPDQVNSMFRAVHSIKGGAASFSLDAIAQFAHAYETILDELRGGQLLTTSDSIPVLYRAADYLADLISLAAAGFEPDPDRLALQTSEIMSLSQAEPVAEPEGDFLADFVPLALDDDGALPVDNGPELPVFNISFTPTAALYANGHEPVQLFRELETLGRLKVDVELDEQAPWDDPHPAATWRLSLASDRSESDIREIFEFAEPHAQLQVSLSDGTVDVPQHPMAQTDNAANVQEVEVDDPAGITEPDTPDSVLPEPTIKPPAPHKSTVRVDLGQVDELINLVGELVITQSVMTQSLLEHSGPVSRNVMATLDDFKSLTRIIQEGIMAIRAQSVKPLFQRMARIVRETAQMAGKEVRFTSEGEDTEVDRIMIERLVDPLTHILRNAVDHGVEMGPDRLQAGKEEAGCIRLSAAHRSGRVVIEVSDDGAGVKRDKVLASAIAKGLIQATAQLSEGEIDRLLFMPGFSTADVVTNLSGRGVGMDVVNSEIRRLGGRVSIISSPGEGTTISISLPLTLAVLDGMIVDVGGETLVVPISAILETIRPDPSQIHQIGPSSRMVAVRDMMVPIIELGQVFGYENSSCRRDEHILFIVEDENGTMFALAVDQIRDQRQVVIKSLESNYGHVPFVAAATILGDGQIALIVDLDEVTHRISNPPPTSVKHKRAYA